VRYRIWTWNFVVCSNFFLVPTYLETTVTYLCNISNSNISSHTLWYFNWKYLFPHPVFISYKHKENQLSWLFPVHIPTLTMSIMKLAIVTQDFEHKVIVFIEWSGSGPSLFLHICWYASCHSEHVFSIFDVFWSILVHLYIPFQPQLLLQQTSHDFYTFQITLDFIVHVSRVLNDHQYFFLIDNV
jgi:hypothetical protein